MKILISIVILFSFGIIVPIQYAESVFDNDNYTLVGTGFVISDKTIETSKISIDFNIIDSVSGKTVDFDKGSIMVSGKEFKILDNFSARLIKEGDLFRINAETENEDRFTVFGKIIGDSKDGAVYSIRGLFTLDDEIEKKVVYSAKILKKISTFSEHIVEEELLPEPIIEEIESQDTDLTVIVKQPHRTYWEEEYVLTARVYDAEENTRNDFNQNWGYLQGVQVSVTITDERGKILTSFRGETNEKGYFVGKYLVEEEIVRTGKYFVDLEANLGTSVITQSFITFILEPAEGKCSPPAICP